MVLYALIHAEDLSIALFTKCASNAKEATPQKQPPGCLSYPEENALGEGTSLSRLPAVLSHHYLSPTIGENPRKEVDSSLPSTIIPDVARWLTTESCSS